MTTRIIQGKDINGYETFDTPFSDTTISFTLTASTVATVTVPANAQTVKFSFTAGDDVWVSLNGTATLPSASNLFLMENGTDFLLLEDNSTFIALENFALSDASNQTLNPTMRFVKGGDHLSFISTAAANVNCQFYTKTYPAAGTGSF